MPNAWKPEKNIIVEDQVCPVFIGPIHQHWEDMARAKGFHIVARIFDRFHLALKCGRCDGLIKTKVFVVMNNQPLCAHCQIGSKRAIAQLAGLKLLRRDLKDRHYAFYKIFACGHEVRRQFELVEEVAEGTKRLRCEMCQKMTECEEAKNAGWFLVGNDQFGQPNYRTYRHEACGHVQRIARANMQTSRICCAGCSGLWSSEPSYIYIMQFTLLSGKPVVKLGFSKNPTSRLKHQLRNGRIQPGQLLCVVPVSTGHDAICIEKSLHRHLKTTHPEALVSPNHYAREIKVKSEIYDISLLPTMRKLLDFVAAFGAAKSH